MQIPSFNLRKGIYKGEKIYNLPNLLSFYRLCMLPCLLYWAVCGKTHLFAVFFIINLLTDVADGFIARRFRRCTSFGASLDNLADMGMYIIGFCGIRLLKWAELSPHALMLISFFLLFFMSYMISFKRFEKMPGLHLYSCVSAGYLQALFFALLFAWKFLPWLYFLCMGWAMLAYAEKIVVLLLIDKIEPGIKGLYWVLKRRGKQVC